LKQAIATNVSTELTEIFSWKEAEFRVQLNRLPVKTFGATNDQP